MQTDYFLIIDYFQPVLSKKFDFFLQTRMGPYTSLRSNMSKM